MSKSNDLITES